MAIFPAPAVLFYYRLEWLRRQQFCDIESSLGHGTDPKPAGPKDGESHVRSRSTIIQSKKNLEAATRCVYTGPHCTVSGHISDHENTMATFEKDCANNYSTKKRSRLCCVQIEKHGGLASALLRANRHRPLRPWTLPWCSTPSQANLAGNLGLPPLALKGS